MSEEAFIKTEVEKANTKLGVIVFKCLDVDPFVPDADGDIIDPSSMEAAFYDFMENQPDSPVDIDHKDGIQGRVVAGWYFPDEHVFRVAFRPKDVSVVERAQRGEFVGSSFAGMVSRHPV